MKIALLNDSHFGARNDSRIFMEYFRKFYEEVFFPYIDKHNIKTLIHAGDMMDRRKYVNYKTLKFVKENFVDEIEKRDIHVYYVVGNHDVFYKNSNDLCSIDLLFSESDNFKIIKNRPEQISIGGKNFAMFPWITEENYEDSMNFLEATNAPIAIGHFEFGNFEILPGVLHKGGLSAEKFKKFERVLSGHYHGKSEKYNVTYLGSQYQITWSDHGIKKGFHVFDTEDDSLEMVENPKTMFEKIFYKEDELSDIDMEKYREKYIKIVVINRENLFKFDKFMADLQEKNPHDVLVIDEDIDMEALEDEDVNIEDTMTFAQNAIDKMYEGRQDVNTDNLKHLFREIYAESLKHSNVLNA